jgi:hypothetical protein
MLALMIDEPHMNNKRAEQSILFVQQGVNKKMLTPPA